MVVRHNRINNEGSRSWIFAIERLKIFTTVRFSLLFRRCFPFFRRRRPSESCHHEKSIFESISETATELKSHYYAHNKYQSGAFLPSHFPVTVANPLHMEIDRSVCHICKKSHKVLKAFKDVPKKTERKFKFSRLNEMDGMFIAFNWFLNRRRFPFAPPPWIAVIAQQYVNTSIRVENGFRKARSSIENTNRKRYSWFNGFQWSPGFLKWFYGLNLVLIR